MGLLGFIHRLPRAVLPLMLWNCSSRPHHHVATDAAPPPSATTIKLQAEPAVQPGMGCADGIDNDGDGLVDWSADLGCTSRTDQSEGGVATGSRESGWTVFEPSASTRIVYVSADGNDDADGRRPETAKRSLRAGAEALRDRSADWLLLRRGDTFKGDNPGGMQHVRATASGLSAREPIVVASFGTGSARPVLSAFELDLAGTGNIAVVDIEFSQSVLNLALGAQNVLVEGCLFRGEGIVANVSKGTPPRRNVTIRRNVATRTNTPFFFAGIDGLLVEENVIDRPGENGQGNHGMYIARVGNSNVVTRHNLVYCGTRGSGNGIKQRPGGIAEGNVIASSKIASIHFGNCNDGDDAVCEAKVTAKARGNLIVASGGIFFDREWVTSGEARDNIITDIPAIVSMPIEGSANIAQSGNIERRKPLDAARPGVTVLGLYNAERLGGDASLLGFFEAASRQRKFDFRPELTAESVIAFARDRLAH